MILPLLLKRTPANPASICLEFGAEVYLRRRRCQWAVRNSRRCPPSESVLAERLTLRVSAQGLAVGSMLDCQCQRSERRSILARVCPLARLESIRLAECSIMRFLTCEFGLWLSLSSFGFSACLTKSSWNPRSSKFSGSASMPAGNAEMPAEDAMLARRLTSRVDLRGQQSGKRLNFKPLTAGVLAMAE